MTEKNNPVQLSMTPIPDKMFFKIRDVAGIVGVKPHVLRYWESEFPTLGPKKNRNGQRMYTRKDIEMALEIRSLLHAEKFSIAGARQKLKKKRSAKSSNGDSLALVALKTIRKDLTSLLKSLKSESAT